MDGANEMSQSSSYVIADVGTKFAQEVPPAHTKKGRGRKAAAATPLSSPTPIGAEEPAAPTPAKKGRGKKATSAAAVADVEVAAAEAAPAKKARGGKAAAAAARGGAPPRRVRSQNHSNHA